MAELYPVPALENQLLTHRIKNALLSHMRAALNGDESLKLPKEEVLAQQLGVSRNGLRDALTILEGEGYISRRRSKGTLVNPRVVRSTCRIDLAFELGELIAGEGYIPRMDTTMVKYVDEPDPEFGGDETGYLMSEKIFYADEDPVALAVDRFPGRVANRVKDKSGLLNNITHCDFMEKYCGESLACVLDDISPILPDPKMAKALNISSNTPILYLEGVGYNHDHAVVWHSSLYLKTGKLNYKILRKRL